MMRTFCNPRFFLVGAFVMAWTAWATTNTPTETIGRATKIRCDGAVLTPPAASWNPDGYGDNYGTVWTGVGMAGYNADFRLTPTNASLYDIMAQVKTGPENAKSEPLTISFKPGGVYYLSPDERITSTPIVNQALGLVTFAITTEGTTFPDAALIYLGRFEAAAAGTLSVRFDAATSTGNFNFHTPVTLWFAETTTNYGPLSYNDYNSVPAGWLWFDTTEFNHYWANATGGIDNVFKTAHFFPFPPGDRAPSGLYDVTFSHFNIWHVQNARLPLVIYFRPGGLFTPPTVGGFVNAVDTTQAAQGRVTVTIDFPTVIGSGPPYPRNDINVGRYEFDNKLYGAKLLNYLSPLTGEAYGPKIVSLAGQGPSEVLDWVLYY